MSAWSVYAAEARHELRAGLRGSLVPLMFVGLVGYVFMMLMNAEYLREMGGADVPRNSSLIVFQITAGQNFWLIFAWAWVFAQVVTRDRAASLHELVLVAPVSLPGLMLARFAGALVLACILGASSSVALLSVPLLAALQLLPAEAVGPTPLSAIASAWLWFVLPTALGLGALYVSAALRTRSNAGPFAVSALVILLWMVAMVVLRGGDIALDLATWMDVSGFGEAERQTKLWTPLEKASGTLAIGRALLINRGLWTLVPLALLGWTLLRVRREALTLDPAAHRPSDADVPARAPSGTARPLLAPERGSALLATWLELRWHLGRALRGTVFRVSLGLWTVINVAGPFVHMVAHVDGPLVPRAKLLAPFLVDLCYVFSVFLVAGFVGVLARADHQRGFDELLDATPAPTGALALGRAGAAAVMTLVLALAPTLPAWIVMAVAAGAPFEPLTPLAFNGLVAAPALLELCGLTFLIHAWVRSAGTAHGLSMLAAFVSIVNHEIGLVAYPPAQLGIPARVALSELAGFSPWLGPLLALDALKLCTSAAFIGLAWLLVPRGVDRGWRWRWRAALERSRQGAGAVLAAGLLGVAALLALLHDRLVVRGGFESARQADVNAAAWEQRYWAGASAFSVAGGDAEVDLDVSARSAQARWTLRGLRSDSGELHVSLPAGMSIEGARAQGLERAVRRGHRHAVIELGSCPTQGCELVLEVRVDAGGWPDGESSPWLHASGVFARAVDLLPRLGHDPERLVRAPALRRELGLPESLPLVPSAGALVPAAGAVAPAGHWRWRVSTPAGVSTAAQGATDAPLDFAVIWLPEPAPVLYAAGAPSVWHGAAQQGVAREVAEDVVAVRRCLEDRFGWRPNVSRVVQVPRSLGALSLHGDLLWLPEHDGWDVGAQGVGRLTRRVALGRALAARWLADEADLRAEPGSRWLVDGVAGWAGLECLRATDGSAAWLRWLDRQSDRVAQALGALSAPIDGLAHDAAARWVTAYAPLATATWATSAPAATRAVGAVVRLIRSGVPLGDALAQTVGAEMSARLLGAPVASDVQVSAEGGALQARGERFRWQYGGWQTERTAFDVVQRYDDDARPARSLRVPTEVSSASAFTLLDALPSYERSPLNNSWPAAAVADLATEARAVRGAEP